MNAAKQILAGKSLEVINEQIKEKEHFEEWVGAHDTFMNKVLNTQCSQFLQATSSKSFTPLMRLISMPDALTARIGRCSRIGCASRSSASTRCNINTLIEQQLAQITDPE